MAIIPCGALNSVTYDGGSSSLTSALLKRSPESCSIGGATASEESGEEASGYDRTAASASNKEVRVAVADGPTRRPFSVTKVAGSCCRYGGYGTGMVGAFW